MVASVRTPITQAMNEGALTRQELKALMARSDRPAFTRLGDLVCGAWSNR